MKVAQRHMEDLLIVDLEGDFDSRSAGVAKEEIRSAIEEGNNRILVNLEGVKYIDSAGLGTLVSAVKTAREQSGNVWLAGLTSHVKMVVELTRLDRVFDVYETVDEAVEELSSTDIAEES